MTKISKEDVLKLAHLARIDVSEDEIAQYQKELSGILTYVEILTTLDLESYKPSTQVTGLTSVTRPDVVVGQPATPEELLKNAPQTHGNEFKVARMIG